MKKIGLTSEEAARSLKKFGNNALSKPPQQTFFDKLLDNFQDPIIRILMVALLVNVVFAYMGHADWLETAGIFVAIILATFVSTWSEYNNENAFQKLQEEASRITCKVWRNGEPMEIRIDDIVTGDAVQLESGDKVPVDGILLEGELKLDQAALNGESEEASKKPAPEGFSWGDTTDFLNPYRLYRGSVVVEGQGVMRAEKIGDASVYGQLTQELKEVDRDSPLKLKLKQLADKISYFGYAGGVLIFFAVLLHKIFLAGSWSAYIADMPRVFGDLMQALILAVIIIVMAVPEGLPLMIAIVSSLNMRKMLRDNVLVRKLTGIETAGSLNLLFTDKTGTITKGKLEVTGFITGNLKEYDSFEKLPDVIKEYTYENIVLNTSAAMANGKIVGGNITERALSQFIGEYRTGNLPLRNSFVPFNSANKYSFASVLGTQEYTIAKGAPEKLVPLCDYYWDEQGRRLPLTDAMKQALENKMLELAGRAIRMLALCTYPKAVSGRELPKEELVLTGILAIRDEVRPEAVEAIKKVHEAGVQIVMITGDRKETAVAIAKDAGLLQKPEDQVWTSQELAAMTDEEVKQNLRKLRVVSRALPLDKLRLVTIAQEMNLVVGMTGDGVNDSPALKRSDVGFAMGSGTEVAKEAGDIVILDDNFLSIKQAILYGRTIYNSICKFITFQLSINVSAVLINFIAPFIGVEKPLTIIQILWINLVMDTLAALAFGGEPALERYMQEEPKKRDGAIVSKGMAATIVLSGLWMTLVAVAFYKSPWVDSLFRSAPDHIYTYTGFFCAYIFMAVANAFNVRVEGLDLLDHISGNLGFLQVMGGILAIQYISTLVGGNILRTAPLLGQEWGVVLICAISIILVDWIRKLFRRQFGFHAPTNK
ncbi:MAG: calcium-translocating P-type ATPase, PMCA-type [Acidaminococcaceae bacterium]|nr:calcium-translocating P-type ATPase, PMCA-type [Acidaminococcaceae bacterium]